MKKLYFLLIALLAINSAMAQGCLPQGITFSTQEQIDNFQTDYPGCTEIEGDVIIDGWYYEITNLNGLNTLTKIKGNLEIIECIDCSHILLNLSGLNNLVSIGGNLRISNVDALTSLNGLENLDSIAGNFLLDYNNSINSFSSLENLTYIGGDLQIQNNSSLINLTGLENLQYVNGLIEIFHNENMTSLYGFEHLDHITSLIIAYNDRLNYLTLPGNIDSIGDYLLIQSNKSLTNLNGLESISSIGSYLGIVDNIALNNLTGLENLTSILGVLEIYFNQSLISVTGLENLDSIGSDLRIRFNPNIINLQSLANLRSIGGTLLIEDNFNLTNLNGLENIDPGTIDSLFITNNTLLTTCAVKSICEYLAGSNVFTHIHDNAPGCNSREEVEAACLVGIENIIQKNKLSIFPNPSSSRFTIQFSLENEEQVKLLVLNNLGQVVATLANETLSEGQHELNWNAEGMPAGVYFYNIQIGKQAGTGKLVLMK